MTAKTAKLTMKIFLIVGILCTVTGIGNMIAWVVDLVTELTAGRITVLAD